MATNPRIFLSTDHGVFFSSAARRLVASSTQHVVSSCINASYTSNTLSRSTLESLVFKVGEMEDEEERDDEEEDATGAGVLF